MFEYSIRWHNPHTEPPDGMPRILAAEWTNQRVCPPAIMELKEAMGYGSGWFVCFHWALKEGKKWSLEAKQRVRRKRMRTRLEKKFPMFAEEFYQEALARKPEYYGSEP